MVNYCFLVRMMWSAGVLAAISSISYPAISAFVSMHADADKQGLVQVSLFLIGVGRNIIYFLFRE
jgi:hypothetical protein